MAPLYESPRFESGEGALAAALDLPLSNPPGTTVEYSCIGFIVLGRIMEQLTGSSLAELFRSIVAKPLQLQDTTYGVEEGKLSRTLIQNGILWRSAFSGESYTMRTPGRSAASVAMRDYSPVPRRSAGSVKCS